MGPISLFDKSFLQGLSVDESVWFDQYFLTCVCPMLYAETLADLDKPGRRGRTAADEVRIIANKFPQMGSYACAHHLQLVMAELMGYAIPFTGQIPLAEGRLVEVAGDVSVVSSGSAVNDAFLRWQRREFTEVERRYAAQWRRMLAKLDLRSLADLDERFGSDMRGCRSLEGAVASARRFVDLLDASGQAMAFAFDALAVPAAAWPMLSEKWTHAKDWPLRKWAPYTSLILEIDMYFRAAMAASLISSDRP